MDKASFTVGMLAAFGMLLGTYVALWLLPRKMHLRELRSPRLLTQIVFCAIAECIFCMGAYWITIFFYELMMGEGDRSVFQARQQAVAIANLLGGAAYFVGALLYSELKFRADYRAAEEDFRQEYDGHDFRGSVNQ